jgi:hypothetical protein
MFSIHFYSYTYRHKFELQLIIRTIYYLPRAQGREQYTSTI